MKTIPLYSYSFRKYYERATGEPIPARQLPIFEHMERQRVRRGYIRALIHDPVPKYRRSDNYLVHPRQPTRDAYGYRLPPVWPPPKPHLRGAPQPESPILKTLRLYLDYLRDHLKIRGKDPFTLVCGHHRRDADQWIGHPAPANMAPYSSHTPHYVRGRTIEMHVHLNVDRYTREAFESIYRDVLSAVDLHPGTVLILHGDFTKRPYTGRFLANRPSWWLRLSPWSTLDSELPAQLRIPRQLLAPRRRSRSAPKAPPPRLPSAIPRPLSPSRHKTKELRAFTRFSPFSVSGRSSPFYSRSSPSSLFPLHSSLFTPFSPTARAVAS